LISERAASEPKASFISKSEIPNVTVNSFFICSIQVDIKSVSGTNKAFKPSTINPGSAARASPRDLKPEMQPSRILLRKSPILDSHPSIPLVSDPELPSLDPLLSVPLLPAPSLIPLSVPPSGLDEKNHLE
jgi:hypothetical protein